MTRLVDRFLARQGTSYAGADYNEFSPPGAYMVSSADVTGRHREGIAAGIVATARDAYASNGVVAACAFVRMSLFAEARFQFQRLSDKSLYGNQDLTILERPWPNADSGELLSRMEQDGGTVAGNAFIRSVEPSGDGDPFLVQMRPDTVTIESVIRPDSMGRPYKVPVGYIQDVRPLGIDADPQTFTPAEICHYSPLPDPSASFRGMSWLSPVLREIRADQTLTQYKTVHLANGAMPGIVIRYSRKLSDQTVETLARRLTAKHGGTENAGKVWVLDEGADMTVAGSTLEQLQMEALTKAGERRICAAAGPGLDVILGFEQGDYMAAVRRLADLWARPHWRMACAALQHLVPNVPDQGVRLWFDVAGIAALREGELQRAQAYLVKTQGLAASVAAGFTRESSVAASASGDVLQLVADPLAPPSGISGRETATEKLGGGGFTPDGRPPQAGVPQDLPGVVAPNLPNAKPWTRPPMPAVPGGARGLNGRK